VRKKIDGLLNPVYAIYKDDRGKETRSKKPVDYDIETSDGAVSILEVLGRFNSSKGSVFLVIDVRREDKDGKEW